MFSKPNGVRENKRINLKKNIKLTAVLNTAILFLLILTCFIPWYHTEIRKMSVLGDSYHDYYLIKSSSKSTRWSVTWDTFYSKYDVKDSDIKHLHYACLALVFLGILLCVIMLGRLFVMWETWVLKKSYIMSSLIWSFVLLFLCWVIVIIYPLFMPDVLGDEWGEKEFFIFNSINKDGSIHSNYPSVGWYFILGAAILSIGTVISSFNLFKDCKNRKGPMRKKRRTERSEL